MENIEFLSAAYITDSGDIFGVDDIDNRGLRQTNHKIIVVENRFFQLGGRNIENSYHMKKNSLSAKYTFMDTDFAAKVTSGGDEIVKAYDTMWNFEPMVADLATIEKFAPFDFIANADAAKAATAQCAALPNKTLEDRGNLENCLKQGLWMKG